MFNRPVGGGGYQTNFKVEANIDKLVELALSGQRGEYIIGALSMKDTLVGGIEVKMEPGLSLISEGVGYKIITEVLPLQKETLKVGKGDFTDFIATQHGESIILQPHQGYEFMCVRPERYGKATGLSLTQTSKVKKYKDDMANAMQEYATVLQCLINGIYKNAHKPAPNKALELSNYGRREEIKIRSDIARTGEATQYSEPKEETPQINLSPISSDITFTNIGGYQNVKNELTDFLLAIKNPEEAQKHGYTPSKGVLLHGPSGTGKTLFGKALAGEAGAQFIYMNSADTLDKYVGESQKILKTAFENAQSRSNKTGKPVILFLDEIDSIFPIRGTAHEVRTDLVNIFNQYMDGFESQKIPNVYVVGATNRLAEMDESATRAGRFIKIEIPLPDLEARTEIFKVTQQEIERKSGTGLFDSNINYKGLSTYLEGKEFSGADIADVMREARKKAFRLANQKGEGVVMTSFSDLETEIKNYTGKKGSKKRRIGFQTP